MFELKNFKNSISTLKNVFSTLKDIKSIVEQRGFLTRKEMSVEKLRQKNIFYLFLCTGSFDKIKNEKVYQELITNISQQHISLN